jgi:hypothetical protein
MTISIVAGIVIFLGSVIVSRTIAAGARSRLQDETKIKIAEVFPKINQRYPIIIFGIMVIFLVVFEVSARNALLITLIYLVSIGGYVLVKVIQSEDKFRAVGATESYFRRVEASLAVLILGGICAVVAAMVIAKVLPA